MFCFSQPVINRTFGTNTVNDPRLMASSNFIPPRYQDTTAANLSIGIDSCSALIFTYNDNSYWMRICSPKRWIKILKTGDVAATVWGTITGTLGNQTDLQNALNLKLNISDTSAMLTPYLNLTGYGILRSGQFFRADTSQLATQYDLTQIPAEGIQATLVAGDSANRQIIFRDLGDSSVTHSFFTQTIRPANYNAVYSTGRQSIYTAGLSMYPGVNPSSGRPNIVVSWMSYNMAPGGSATLLPGEGGLGMFFETHFEQGGGNPYFELYPQMIQSNGFAYRPFFSVIRKDAREHTYTRKITTENVLWLSPTGADDTVLHSLTASGHTWRTLGNFGMNLINARNTLNTFSIALDNDGPIIGGTGSSQTRTVISTPIQVGGYIRNTNTYGGEVLLGQTAFTSSIRFLPVNQAISTRAGIFNQVTATEVTYIGIGINSSFLFGNGVTANTGGSMFFTTSNSVPSIQFVTKAAGSTTDIIAGSFGQNGNFNVGGGAITTPPEEITVDVRSSAVTNTIVTNEASRHTTSGTAAAGFGVQKSWILETGAGAERTVSLDAVSLMSATNTQEYAQRIFYLMTNGAAASEKMRLTGLGTLHIGAYTAGVNVDSRGLYINRSIGMHVDSSETITSIGSDFVQVLDATTGKFKKITAANFLSSSNVLGSTYTPTLTNTTNVSASVASVCSYTRDGNVIHVAGMVQIDATLAATVTELELSLPVASNFTDEFQLAGTTVATYNGGNEAGNVRGHITNDRALLRFYSTSTDNQAWYFTFTYRVL